MSDETQEKKQETPPPPEAALASQRQQVVETAKSALGDLSAQIETDLGRFTGLAKEDSDFAGSDENLEANDAFNTARNGLKAFFETNQSSAPAHLQKAWRDAAVDFMIAEIQSYNNAPGTMGIREAELSLAKLKDPEATGLSGKKGVGSFEVWIKTSPQAAEYEKWQTEKAGEAARQKEQAEAKARAEAAAQAPPPAPAEAPKPPETPPPSGEIPIGDKILQWADQLEDGALKDLAVGIASLFATLCTTKWIGSFFRGKLLSNRALAEKYNDPEAARMVKVENVFLRFGLAEELARDLANKNAPEAIARMTQKAGELTADTALQAKIVQLGQQLQAKGGTSYNGKLIDFMNQDAVAALAPAPAQPAQPQAPAQTPAEAAPESPDQKMARIFEGMTPDDQTALKGAKAKDVANGTLPDSLKNNDRAIKIAAKLKENGAAEATVDANQTVAAFIAAHLDKDWNIA